MEFNTQLLYPSDQILLALMIFIIMLGMGASLTVDDFRAVGRRPRGVLIGFISQFGLMPFLAFTLATLLGFPPAFAIALILIGCLPGGTFLATGCPACLGCILCFREQYRSKQASRTAR
jgi:predicted Na+-dependent transporter